MFGTLLTHIAKNIAYTKICLDSGEVLAWLHVSSEVQMICIWSSWCHCHTIISCFIKIQTGILLVSAYLIFPGKEAVKWVSDKVNFWRFRDGWRKWGATNLWFTWKWLLNGVCIFRDLEMGPEIPLITLFCHSPHGIEAEVLLLWLMSCLH